MIKFIKYLLFAVPFSALMFGEAAQAQTINAATCNSSDVQAALNKVVANGTTVNIPSGNCAWTSQVSLKTSLSVTIQGQGVVATSNSQGNPATYTDNTTITDGGTNYKPLFSICGNGSGGPIQELRITGLTIKQTAQTTYEISMCSDGTASGPGGIRIDHNHFVGLNPAVRIWSGYGVIDHNLVDAPSGTSNSFQIFNGAGNRGEVSFTQATQLGTGYFIFIENNTVHNGFANDCEWGCRYVLRYNTLTGVGGNEPSIQEHGTGSFTPTGGEYPWRGGRSWEVYGNVATSTYSGGAFAFGQHFSGTGVHWGNTVTGMTHDVYMHNIRDEAQTNYSQAAPPTGWGYCGTSQTGVTSPWDGNQNLNGSNGAPCLDQPGRGKNDLIIGSFPNVCDSTAGDCTKNIFSGRWTNQSLEPIYVWNETWNCPGCSGGPLVSTSSNGNNIVNNRDYYFQCDSHNSTCSSGFTGATGVGSGMLSSRPSTCSAGPGGSFYMSPTGSYGVGYWATDKNTLYVCTSTNTWMAIYTPYTYPHPLVQGSGSGSQVVAPSNLSAVVQ